MIINQGYLFLIFIINGIIIGLLFDFFRILRKSFKTKDTITYIEDILFWILTGVVILYSIFTFNNGEIRLFMFLAIILGIILYILTVSSYVIKINVKIVTFIKNIITKFFYMIIIPFKYISKFIKKIFFKPISFITINFRKISTKILKKTNNIVKRIKNSKHIVKN